MCVQPTQDTRRQWEFYAPKTLKTSHPGYLSVITVDLCSAITTSSSTCSWFDVIRARPPTTDTLFTNHFIYCFRRDRRLSICPSVCSKTTRTLWTGIDENFPVNSFLQKENEKVSEVIWINRLLNVARFLCKWHISFLFSGSVSCGTAYAKLGTVISEY